MPSGDRQEDKPNSLLFRYLRTWQRGLMGLLALLMLGFSPYAILQGHDGLATSTFVLAGLVVAAVAITGVVPRRMTYKDATIEFIVQERVQREVQVAVEEVADEVAESTDWPNFERLIAEPDPWDTPPPAVEAFSRRVRLVRNFEDRSLAALQDYAQARGLEVRQSSDSGGPDCYLTDSSKGFELPVVFKYSWSNDSVSRIPRFSMPRVLFICSQVPNVTQLGPVRNERLGIHFAIVNMVTTAVDHAISSLRGEDLGPRNIAALPGGGWYVSLPLED